ncbi:hypothetical protein D3C73_713780 [compost metagenome]
MVRIIQKALALLRNNPGNVSNPADNFMQGPVGPVHRLGQQADFIRVGNKCIRSGQIPAGDALKMRGHFFDRINQQTPDKHVDSSDHNQHQQHRD